ncbi:N2,N2-dimethylguanosine tRNA methyltransferase [Rhinocladiella mackenziei CBS 650.93]|uniref:tRNA (guanine(26)-N(2))-dimethyltransferase n=1 Tax=Rhinocladiella mackenziei CBS 650.93 TaxID=1442369 RepID=A0A0D2FL28_9EURO|nr:N2,N2-dimethylguanosine tRNA methyltransferase [Rhinocladiella mackenziei CBS 650.93]KIX02662.1 N2,N2-dimethylguanosine tRNA methyltransferase [Rhinocladiella mackenziei CBS 650.93]
MASSGHPETLIIDGKKYRDVHEGSASVLAPYGQQELKQGRNNDEGSQAVFYNPIQQFNRDLSVLAITVYGEGAVLEKERRYNQKNARHGKNKKHNRNQQSPAEVQIGNGSEETSSLKRKADQLADQDGDSIPAENKIVKRTDDPEDADEELPVMELKGDPPEFVHNGEGEQAQSDANQKEPGSEACPAQTSTKKHVPFSILDALSATGLRALRYAKEIPFATDIVANDLSELSVRNIELNIKHNRVEDKVHSNLGDARAFMYSRVGNWQPRRGEGYVHRFDVIDLDPYGTAAPFFDASLQALQDGGMLCVTCTDAGVFASTGYPEKTFALYGGTPMKGPHSHEGGLRLIVHAVAMSAAKYGLAVEPLLSLYIDFYARLFIRVHRQQQEVKLLAGTTMMVYNCGHGCGAWTTQSLLRHQELLNKNGDPMYKFSLAQAPSTPPNCEHCGSKMHLSGPMWSGPLHNPHFVQRMLERVPSLDKNVYGTTDRLEGMLTLALEEDLTLHPSTREDSTLAGAENDSNLEPQIIPRLPPRTIDSAPFFIVPNQLAKVIHCATPSEDMMRGAIRSLGYRVTRSHCKPGSIKTNTPWSVLWEIVREFMRTKAPIREGAIKQASPGWNVLAKLRGSERALVSDFKDSATKQLGRCETKEDLKTVLQGMLWRLENGAFAVSANGDGENPKAQAQSEGQGEDGEPPSHHSRSRAHSPASRELKIVFDEKLGREKQRGKLVRYQMNPRENWGPMNRAGRMS